MTALREVDEPQRKAGLESRARVQIYLSNCIVYGDMHCPGKRRLLDVLNGIPVAAGSYKDDFLVLTNAGIQLPNRPEQKLNTIWVHRAGLLFVRELGERFKGIGEAESRAYPYVSKNPQKVAVHMPSYVLTGHLHCAEKTNVADLLNSEPMFVALTKVSICPVTGEGLSEVDFIAVNKGQILSVS